MKMVRFMDASPGDLIRNPESGLIYLMVDEGREGVMRHVVFNNEVSLANLHPREVRRFGLETQEKEFEYLCNLSATLMEIDSNDS
jgi:hypothetical protein